MRRRSIPSTVIAGTILFLVIKGWADVPPPPVNQTLGMVDVATGTLTEADCRVCHDSGVPDRHHLLSGQPIPPGSLVPYPDADGDGTPDAAYACLNCHLDPDTVVRDCTVCHTESPHHTTAAATSGDCVSCHGDLVDNAGDGHYIPSYDPSLVTPAPSGGDGLPLNSRGYGAGACNYCHDNDGLPVPAILTNRELHHSASLNCAWCHDVHGAVRIRVCEGCHGPDSLHNIQADSNGGGVVVGGEDAGYGHVGRDAGPGDSDCWGCHGFATAGLAPFSGPLVPTVHKANRVVVKAGTDTLVELSGSAFTNSAAKMRFKSDAVLTAADGSSVILKPSAIDQGLLAITVPGKTAPGNYNLKAVKRDGAGNPVASNPIVISIVPEVLITGVTASDGIVTIEGSGFGGYAKGPGTSVTGQTGAKTVEPKIVSWSDTAIKADFGGASPKAITVESVFGTDTYLDRRQRQGQTTREMFFTFFD